MGGIYRGVGLFVYFCYHDLFMAVLGLPYVCTGSFFVAARGLSLAASGATSAVLVSHCRAALFGAQVLGHAGLLWCVLNRVPTCGI